MTTETTDSAMYVPHPTRRVVLRPFRVFNAEGVPYRNRRRFATAGDAAAWMAESGVSGFIQNQVSGVTVARHHSVGAPGAAIPANAPDTVGEPGFRGLFHRLSVWLQRFNGCFRAWRELLPRGYP